MITSVALPTDRAFTSAEASAAGLTAEQMRGRVQRGSWVRLRRGVFVLRDTWGQADERDRHLLLAREALRTAPADAVLSHGSAALLQQLETIDPWKATPPTLTAMLPRSHRAPKNLRRGLYRAALPPPHVERTGFLPVTAPARTVVDLARGVPFDAGVVLADSALRRKLCSLEEVHATYLHCRTWPGALAAGKAVFFADPTAESPLESVVRAALHEQGLPRPQTQVDVSVGGVCYRPDFLWDEQSTILEADGMAKYVEVSVLRDEKLREDRLREMGFEVVRVTWKEIRGEPHAVADRVRAAFVRARRR